MLTSRFFAYLPGPLPSPLPSEADPDWQRVVRFVRAHKLYLVREDPFLVASARSSNTRFLLDVFEGTAAAGFDDLPQDRAALHEFAARRIQFYNLLEIAPDSFRLESDPLGLKPYFAAHLPNGLALASSVFDLLACFPDLAKPIDGTGVLEFLVYSAPLRDRTLHRSIKRPLPGTCIRWAASEGLRIDRGRRLRLPEVDASVTALSAMGRVHESMRRSVQALAGGAPAEVVLPLTGGFDSRLIACTSAELSIATRAWSIGSPHHDEIRVARAVAASLGIPHGLVPYAKDLLELADTWLRVTEGQHDTSTLFIANLLALSEPDGAPLFHGFLGDALSGAHLGWLRADEFAEAERMAVGIERRYTNSVNPRLPSLLGLPDPFGCITEDIRQDLCDAAALARRPHQAFMLWDLENRQRRQIAPQLQYLGTKFRAGAPAYSSEVIESWLSLPFQALAGRTLLRQIFSTFYRSVSGLPHSEESPGRLPNSFVSARYVAGYYGRLLGNKVLRKALGKQLHATITKPRDPYIWHLWHSASPEQKRYTNGRLEELRVPLERFGCELPPGPANSWESLDADPDRHDKILRRLWGLGEYAARLIAAPKSS